MYLRHTMRIQYSNCLPQGMLQQHIPTPVYSCILKPLSILFCKLLQIANIYTMSFLRTTLALTEGSSNLSFTKSLALMHIPCKWKHPDGLKLTSTTQAHIADHELTNPGIILGTLACAITAHSTLSHGLAYSTMDQYTTTQIKMNCLSRQSLNFCPHPKKQSKSHSAETICQISEFPSLRPQKLKDAILFNF